jgi:trk system potassium uptake protein TrkA
MGAHVARTLIYPHVLDYIALGGDDYVVEFEVPETLDQRSLSELQLSEHYGIEVLALKRGDSAAAHIVADVPVARGDRLVLLGRISALRRFSRELS